MTRSAPIERTISRFLVLHTPGHTSLAETETLDGRHTHAVYGAIENGGYLSVTSTKAYATTRAPHRMTPWTKSNWPLGYRPVNKMAYQAMITTTITAIHRKNSTM